MDTSMVRVEVIECPSGGFPNSGGLSDLQEIPHSLTVMIFVSCCRLGSQTVQGISDLFFVVRQREGRKTPRAGPVRRHELLAQECHPDDRSGVIRRMVESALPLQPPASRPLLKPAQTLSNPPPSSAIGFPDHRQLQHIPDDSISNRSQSVGHRLAESKPHDG